MTKPKVRIPSNLVGPAYTTDGYQNFVSRIGHGKAAAGTYAATYSTQAEIINAYKTSWLGKIIDIKAEDSVREWRNWIAADDEIELIEAEESRLQLRQKIMEADKQAMLRGGSAILMGGLPGKPDTPLAPDRIAQGGLKYLTVLTRDQITPSERVGDPMDPNYGKAREYTLTSTATNGITRVHPSRVIIFTGQPKLDTDLDWDGGWGDPVWSGLKSAITNADAVATGIAEMVQEAKIDVIGIPGLMANLATQEYENQLMRRIQLMNMMKSLVNAWVKDAGDSEGKGGETFEQKQLSFAGLPDIWDRSWMELSGKSDIPQTRLLGRSPAGMNATGDSDAKNYAAMVKARQELKLQPTIAPLDEALIWSALGKRPKEIWYQWRSLYQISEKEGAEVEKTYGEAFRSRLDSGAFADDMLAKGELNRMVESGRYPGIEDAISEAENDGITDPEEAEAKELERMTAEAEIAAAGKPVVVPA